MAKFTNTGQPPKELTSITIRVENRRLVRLNDVKARVASDIEIKVVGSAIKATIRKAPYNGKLGIWNVDISAGSSASTKVEKVQAKYKGEVVATLDVEVQGNEKILKLPGVMMPSGLLTRLFIAESINPRDLNYNSHNVKVGMQWMKLVVYNRLSHEDPKRFAANKGGKFAVKQGGGKQSLGDNSNWDIFDIVMAANIVKGRASVQFHGFNTYPKIEHKTQININEILRIANDYAEPKQDKYASFVKAAISVAQSPNLISDPCPTGLYGWRTAKSRHPGEKYFELYKSYAGQDFYTLKK